MTEEQNNQEDNNQENLEDGENGQEDNTQDNSQEDNNEDAIEDKDPEIFDYDKILADAEDDEDDEDGSKKSQKAIEAINDFKLNNAVDKNLNDYFDKNPEVKEFRSNVEKFVKHSERIKFIKNGLPVSAVIAEALAPYQQRIGALKAKAADAEANRLKDGGSSTPPKSPGKTDFTSMKSTDIRRMARDVKNGRYNG